VPDRALFPLSYSPDYLEEEFSEVCRERPFSR
jgi:hypothetical protein